MRPSHFLAAFALTGVALFAQAEAKYKIPPEVQELLKLEEPVQQRVCYNVLARQSATYLKMASDKELFTEVARKDYLVKSTTYLYRSVLFEWSSSKTSDKVQQFAKAYTDHVTKSDDSADVFRDFCNATMATYEEHGAVPSELKQKAVQEALTLLKAAASGMLNEGGGVTPGHDSQKEINHRGFRFL